MRKPTAFNRLAQLGEALEATRSRLEKARLIANYLHELAPDEVAAGVHLLLGQPFAPWEERALNVSWSGLSEVVQELIQLPPERQRKVTRNAVDGGQALQLLLEAGRRQPLKRPRLSLLDVQRGFEAVADASGQGSRARKAALLKALLLRTTPLEAKYLAKNILGEMRTGVSEGLMLEGIARAIGVKPALVRRAHQLAGDAGEVAALAMRSGAAGLEAVPIRVGRPLQPMLAETADSVAEAFEAAGGSLALEYKLDGARVQIHKNGKQVRIFSRNLNEVTESLPEVAEQVRHHLQARQAILDGEVIAVDAEGRPRPFQEVLRRFRRVHEIDELTADQPVRLSLFDVLYRDGKRLLDRPYAVRWKVLEQIGGPISRVARCVPASVAEGDAFARQAREAGHEGVMAKRLDSPYTPGVRGKLWFKIKHALTLDLVIVAADWGYGRRHGWLSNYHLAARDEETGEFWEVGKTFKGLTDAEFAEMTARLQKLKRKESRSTVTVRPEVVVEVTFNELQRSRAYPSGMALRFARIARLRPDKRADQADTIQTLRVLFERQFQTKARAAQSLDSR